MKSNEEIEKVLKEGYNVQSNVEEIFGEWIVTSDGDLISLQHHYPIYSYQIDDDTWLLHMEGKTWFDEKCKQDFLKAFNKSCEIQNIKVVFSKSYK